ncbi:hypothetical protein LINPERHAP2_LOCUS35206, partial [Linum perenne]
IEYFDAVILKTIRNKTSTAFHTDHTKLEGNWGNFVRICVKVDLSKPLLSKYRLRRRVRRIEYEGLHIICYTCGCYGHNQESCVTDQIPEKKMDANVSYEEGLMDMPEVVEDFGPWMLVKRGTRKSKNQKDNQKSPTKVDAPAMM